MDALHLCISLGPLAAYLFLLGLINLAPRPLLTSGARDMAALAIAVSGFIIAGPLDLFMPEMGVARFGAYVWLPLIALYALCVTLAILLLRPRLVIYNISYDQVRPILAGAVSRLDAEARWAGDTVWLPTLGVQLHVEPARGMRNVQLVAVGARQSFAGWRRLERELAGPLARMRVQPNPRGLNLLFFAAIITVAVGYALLNDREALAPALRELLRR